MDVLKEYPVSACFRVVQETDMDVHRFDSLYRCAKVALLPDYLHIDVQGFEYEVLEGMGEFIDGVTCTEIESHLKPIYKGQKMFFEMKAYLESKGYFLRDVQSQGPFEGEVLELNAFFTRREQCLDDRGKSLVRLWERICRLKPRSLFDSRKQMLGHPQKRAASEGSALRQNDLNV